MIDETKEAIVERIKTPAIGTFILSFAYFNYLQIHKLIVAFYDLDATQKAYLEIDWNILFPFLFTLFYIALASVVRVLLANIENLVDMVIKSSQDFFSEKHRRENLREINKLNTIIEKYKVRIERSKKLATACKNYIETSQKNMVNGQDNQISSNINVGHSYIRQTLDQLESDENIAEKR